MLKIYGRRLQNTTLQVKRSGSGEMRRFFVYDVGERRDIFPRDQGYSAASEAVEDFCRKLEYQASKTSGDIPSRKKVFVRRTKK